MFMKKVFATALVIFSFLSFSIADARWTNGYTRKDGTYVNGYYSYHPTDGTGTGASLYIPSSTYYTPYAPLDVQLLNTNIPIDKGNSSYPGVCPDNKNGYLGIGYKCYCNEGFKWDYATNKCLKPSVTPACLDMVNGYLASDGKCFCNNGFVWGNNENKCVKSAVSEIKPTSTNPPLCKNGFFDSVKKKCVSYNYVCSIIGGTKGFYSLGLKKCSCGTGYHWDSTVKKACVKNLN